VTSDLFQRIRLSFVAVCAAFVGGQWLGATFQEPLVALLAMAPALPLFLLVRESLPAMGVNGLPGIACFLGTLPMTAVGLGVITAPVVTPGVSRAVAILRGSFVGVALASALSMPWLYIDYIRPDSAVDVPEVPEFFLSFYSMFEWPIGAWPSPWPRMLIGAAVGAIAGLLWAERRSIARRIGHLAAEL